MPGHPCWRAGWDPLLELRPKDDPKDTKEPVAETAATEVREDHFAETVPMMKIVKNVEARLQSSEERLTEVLPPTLTADMRDHRIAVTTSQLYPPTSETMQRLMKLIQRADLSVQGGALPSQ